MVTAASGRGPQDEEDRDQVDAEHAVLTTAAGRELLRAVEAAAAIGVGELARWRAVYPAPLVAAAARLVEARRRARGKIERVEELWLERVGVEQATHSAVARYKAKRFAERGASRVWDLCCGLGFDAVALAEAGACVVAVDRSQAACRRALWNLRARGLADRAVVVRGRAEELRPRPGEWLHIDPDRRAGSLRSRDRRADSLDGYVPDLAFLKRLAHSGASGAIKLGPASDFARAFVGEPVEIELVSLAAECKEATVWFGEARSCSRRATCLPAGATWSDRDANPAPVRIADHPLAVIFDPDPTLPRSGLLDHFAAAHDLARLAEAGDWLTGVAPRDSPFLRGFQVIAVAPADPRRLRARLRSLGAGSLEVRSHGIRQSPDEIRHALRLGGHRSLTLFLHGGQRNHPGRAIIAEPIPARQAIEVAPSASDNHPRSGFNQPGGEGAER